jgi:DNA modification methylase
MGKHRLFCGDALDETSCKILFPGDQRAQMIFSDPPYNVKISGVSGKGKVKHAEFAMASGEMSRDEFTEFLTKAFTNMAAYSQDGSIHFLCSDSKHLHEMLTAGERVYSELKNLISWVKANAGMGTFYRSRFELIWAFKKGRGPHVNNFGLGETGRWRSNVWEYAGQNSFGANRDQLLQSHPTVKPSALVADAIRDCSHRGGIILDAFVGSGTLYVAAERTGRIGYGIEYSEKYCDVAVRRWEKLTGKAARLEATGLTFVEVAQERGVSLPTEGAQ